MWNVLWSISWARLCGPEKPMIMSSSIGVEKDTCKGGSWSSRFIKERFQPFSLENKTALKMEKRHKLIIMVESAIIKKSLVIHRLLTAGRWGLNKHSQRRVDFGEDAPCFPNCGGWGAVPPGPPWAPQATFQLATSGESSPAWGQCPIEGFRMPWIPTGRLCLAPLLRLLLPSLPSPNLSLFSDGVFPNPKVFCRSRSPCPAITPGWARRPPAAVSSHGDRGEMLRFIQRGTK